MRLFVAVEVPDDLRDAIESSVVTPLRDVVPGARWTRPDGRHLTLAFLGEVADDRVGDVGAAVAEAAAGHQPFEAAFDALGGFPSLRRPRVLWVGLGRGGDAMAGLAVSVQRTLEPEGYVPEDRPFRPHLTVARFKTPRTIGELPAVDVPASAFVVADVTVFRSQLHPHGARYIALQRFPLG